jgi:hypothetical protein
VEVYLDSFFTLGARWGWVVNATSRPLYTGKENRYPLYRRLSGPMGRSGQVQKISPPPGFDPRTLQPGASRCTDWAVPAPNTAGTKLMLSGMWRHKTAKVCWWFGENYCLRFPPRKLAQQLYRNLQSIRHSTRRLISESFSLIFTTQKNLKRPIMSTSVIYITCAVSLNEHPV